MVDAMAGGGAGGGAAASADAAAADQRVNFLVENSTLDLDTYATSKRKHLTYFQILCSIPSEFIFPIPDNFIGSVFTSFFQHYNLNRLLQPWSTVAPPIRGQSLSLPPCRGFEAGHSALRQHSQRHPLWRAPKVDGCHHRLTLRSCSGMIFFLVHIAYAGW